MDTMRPFLKINFKIAVILLLTAVLASTIFNIIIHEKDTETLNREAEIKAATIVGYSKATLEHLMLEGKNRIVERALRTSLSFPQIRKLFITSRDGKIVIDAGKDTTLRTFDFSLYGNMPVVGENLYASITEQGKSFEYIFSSIDNKKECYGCHSSEQKQLGILVAKISTDDLAEIARQHRIANILISVLSFSGLVLVSYIALAFIVIRPLKALTKHIEKIEQQIDQSTSDTQLILPTIHQFKTQDEIATLTTVFNELITRLNDVNDRLHTLHIHQLQEADRIATVGEMAASIAHEIKNPATGILGVLKVFDKETSTSDPNKEIIQEMIVQAGRILNAVTDLLRYARPALPQFETIEINDLINKTISLLSQQTHQNGIDYRTDFIAQRLLIYADKKLIQQLFWNIILNGVEAIGEEGTLTVRTFLANGSCCIEINDTGKGISQSIQQTIFKPFFTTKHKGTGLGLAICKKIVEQHFGKISLTSIEGKGTTFIIQFPAIHGDERNA